MSDGITDSEKAKETFHSKQKRLLKIFEDNSDFISWKWVYSDKFEVEIK